MTDNDRYQFDLAIDSLAKILRLTPLESEAKFGYFKALKGHSLLGLCEGINKLTQTFKPRRKDDFPVPAIISEAIADNLSKPEAEESRSYEEIQASYRRRGILIGDEAKRRLEDEIIANVEAKSGERIDNREVFFNGQQSEGKPLKNGKQVA